MSVPESAVERWLLLAGEDLRLARVALAQTPPITGPALFHCQQAGEKALKAVLAAAGAAPPRTHDLTLLLDLCVREHPSLERVRDDAEALADYAIEPRYPEALGSYSPAEAADAVDGAQRIVDRASAEVRHGHT